MYEIISGSEMKTKEIAARIAKNLRKGDMITLEGELGVGKTTFTKGIAEGLEVTRTVTSPTFTIVKQYKGTLPLYHMDAYRLENSEEDIGFDEYFDGDGVCVVEWAQFIEDFLPEERLAIHISYLESEKRKLIFRPIGTYYETMIRDIVN